MKIVGILVLVWFIYSLLSSGSTDNITESPKPSKIASIPKKTEPVADSGFLKRTWNSIKSATSSTFGKGESPKKDIEPNAVVIAKKANIRKAPSKSAKIVGVLPMNTPVKIGNNQDGWSGIVCSYGGEVINGWVSSNLLKRNNKNK